MFRKVLVANRGEIAIRAFRAAYELGAGTVAVFPHEDRNSLHRLKADESYEIGEPGHPVRAYLSVDEIINAAQQAGADAIYPGYGFLSENPDLARACAAAGIAFIGPPADVLELAGNKVRALAAVRVSLPSPPFMVSSPPKPNTSSSPESALIRSASVVPLSGTSLPSVPVMVAMISLPVAAGVAVGSTTVSSIREQSCVRIPGLQPCGA